MFLILFKHFDDFFKHLAINFKNFVDLFENFDDHLKKNEFGKFKIFGKNEILNPKVHKFWVINPKSKFWIFLIFSKNWICHQIF